MNYILPFFERVEEHLLVVALVDHLTAGSCQAGRLTLIIVSLSVFELIVILFVLFTLVDCI